MRAHVSTGRVVAGCGAVAVVAVAVHAVGFAIGDADGWAEHVAWALAGVFAVLGSAAATAATGGRERLAPLLWTVGSLFFLAGTAPGDVYGVLGFTDGASARAVFWSMFALFAIAGLAYKPPTGSLSFPLFALDAVPLVLLAIAGVLLWTGRRPVDANEAIVIAVLPALNALLALVAMQVVVGLGFRRAPLSTRLAAAGFVIAAAVAFVWASPLEGGAGGGYFSDPLWTLALLLVGAAGFTRAASARDVGVARRTYARDSGLRATAAATAVVALVLVDTWTEAYDAYFDWFVLASVCAFAASSVVARYTSTALTLREREARAEADRARHDLARQNAELQHLDRMKDDFVASVSHELRTPLTSIRGYLELVLDGEAGAVNDEQRQFLEVVQRNADRLLRVVTDLLFVAQVDAGKLALDRDELDLVAVAAESVQAARPVAEARAIELSLDAPERLLLDGDRSRLAQLVDNLVSNALKFTPAGGHVAVRLARPDAHAVIEVADTGMGVAEADQPRLFERFFRTQEATDAAVTGTGLGLAISKAIVDAHGGRIAVESRPGRGTTFRVELPADVRERVAAAERS